MNTRFLGAMMMVGSAAVNSLRTSDNFDPVSSLVLGVWALGGTCGLVGMLRPNALGSNPVARAAAFLPILGFATLIVSDTLRLAGVFPLGTTVNGVLATLGWVGVLAGMLVAGIVTIAAKVWTGWRRFVPLVAVVSAPSRAH